jgi:hypothetical protein
VNARLLIVLLLQWGLLFVCLCLAPAQAAQEKAILDVAPSLTELGAGWTTNSIVTLLDPLSHPSGVAFKKQPDAKVMTNFLQTPLKTKGQMGWGRFHYGRGDMVLNGGLYFVSLQRWGNTNALEKAWKGWKTRPDNAVWRGPPIGEHCYWTEDEKFHGLTFRRGLFHAVVTSGSKSDRSGLIRIAEVIDDKITGRPIPKQEEARIDPPAKGNEPKPGLE